MFGFICFAMSWIWDLWSFEVFKLSAVIQEPLKINQQVVYYMHYFLKHEYEPLPNVTGILMRSIVLFGLKWF